MHAFEYSEHTLRHKDENSHNHHEKTSVSELFNTLFNSYSPRQRLCLINGSKLVVASKIGNGSLLYV